MSLLFEELNKMFSCTEVETTKDARRRHLLMTYKLTPDDFNNMLTEQDYKCKICEVMFDEKIKTHVDHCHKRGHVRGILCSSCNMGLGFFKDEVSVLQKAIKYLKENRY